MDRVGVFGFEQRLPSVRVSLVDQLSRIPSDSALKVSDSSKQLSYAQVLNAARNLNLSRHLNIESGGVLVVQVPCDVEGLILVYSCLIQGLCVVPLAFDTDPEMVRQVLDVSMADLYVTTAQKLWDVEYELVRLGIQGVTLTCYTDLPPPPTSCVLSLKYSEEQVTEARSIREREVDQPALYFFDQVTASLRVVTHRALSALVPMTLDGSAPSLVSKRDVVCTSLDAFSLIRDVLPKLLIGEGQLVLLEKTTKQARKRRLTHDTPMLRRSRASQIAKLVLHVGRHELGGSDYLRLGVQTDDGQVLQQATPKTQGRLVFCGSSMLGHSLLSVSETVKQYCYQSGQVWCRTEDVVQVGDDGVSLELMLVGRQQQEKHNRRRVRQPSEKQSTSPSASPTARL